MKRLNFGSFILFSQILFIILNFNGLNLSWWIVLMPTIIFTVSFLITFIKIWIQETKEEKNQLQQNVIVTI